MAPRSAGLLLHPTSLPGPFGIGDLGVEVNAFLEWAQQAGQSLWQILPLGPTGHHNSPYSSLSACAGNPLLLSIETLRDEGLLTEADVEMTPSFSPERVDFGRLISWKKALLRKSWEKFRRHRPRDLQRELEAFTADSRHAPWLDDWALFSSLKVRFGGKAWSDWPRELRLREPRALASARERLSEEMESHRYLQLLFHRQWQRVKSEAHRRGIRVMGDVPIYVALDSADVWANARLFEIDDEGRPLKVAGVPPDDFSDTGQLWGNPLYRWKRMAEEGYVWWITRIRESLCHADLLRIDHFRGFASYWEVPAGEPSAKKGRWRPGPGTGIFAALREALGDLPFVAEDLGHITPDVRELLEALGLPGMKVLQFAFDSPDSDHLPENIGPHNIVYTGTHDNDTVRGWFAHLGPENRKRALDYLGTVGKEVHWDFIRAAYRSAAEVVVIPVQDVLGSGSEARMNDPRRVDGNWSWRVRKEDLGPGLAIRLRQIAEQTGRLPSRPA